ncbi:MAG TPA: hypothetical protein HPP87_07815 [Planctomycetes bacterium]|nr:hypothetical protein [Planctomycetota bacterium]
MSSRKYLFLLRALSFVLVVWLFFTFLLPAGAADRAGQETGSEIIGTDIEDEIANLLEEITTERRFAIERHFESILSWLQDATEAAMCKKDASLSALGESERQLKKGIYESREQVPKETGLGLLSSILYSVRFSSVVIDGRILHEGEMIHGVEVVKINTDTVELCKEETRWHQEVGMSFPAEAGGV